MMSLMKKRKKLTLKKSIQKLEEINNNPSSQQFIAFIKKNLAESPPSKIFTLYCSIENMNNMTIWLKYNQINTSRIQLKDASEIQNYEKQAQNFFEKYVSNINP